MSGVKKSKFTSRTDVDNADTFDFVANGQNFKIPASDLSEQLGLTGSIVQKGEITGYPVLNKDGLVNEIRNLIQGSGIKLDNTPEDGISITHNFINGSGGVDILSGLDEEQVVAKNIVAGDGVTVSGSATGVQISVSGDPPVSTNTVIVNEMTDFPAAVGGVITLEDDTQYFITNDLITSNRFETGDNCVLTGSDAQVASLTYTGTGIMFTSVDSTSKAEALTIIASTGTFIDWSSTKGTGKQFLTRGVIIEAATLGTIAGIDGLSFFNTTLDCSTDGFTIEDDNALVSVSDIIGVVQAGTLFDFGVSTNDAVSLRNMICYTSAGTYIMSGAVDSANINAGKLGNVINVRNIGAGGFSNGITERDSLWEFYHNDGIADSIIALLAIHSGSTITIAAINTPVQVDTNWTYDHESRFEGTVGGRWTYTGKGGHTSISAAISAIGTVSQSRNYEFLLYKNGVAISGAVFERDFNNNGAGSLSIVWQEDFATDDYLEIFVQNTESTDNLTINSITLGISG